MKLYPPNQDAEICRKKVIKDYGSFQLFNELSTTNLIKCPILLTTFESIPHLASRDKTAKTS